MPTFIMLPDGDILQEWHNGPIAGASTYESVNVDNGDTRYAYSDASNERMHVSLEAPPVPDNEVGLINSVRLGMKARKAMTFSGGIRVNQTGVSDDSSPIVNGVDNITVTTAPGYTTYTAPAKATSDGTHNWVYGDLTGLQLRITKFRNDRFGQTRISYLYAEVNYTEPAEVKHNATFFGTNF